jgi:hypothetical protein
VNYNSRSPHLHVKEEEEEEQGREEKSRRLRGIKSGVTFGFGHGGTEVVVAEKVMEKEVEEANKEKN